MILPSEELLSEVLKGDAKDLISFNLSADESAIMLHFIDSDDYINIYELMHKMKEWALNKGYELRTSIRGVVDFYYVSDKHEFIDSSHLYNDEFDSITKVCEQIFKELKCTTA